VKRFTVRLALALLIGSCVSVAAVAFAHAHPIRSSRPMAEQQSRHQGRTRGDTHVPHEGSIDPVVTSGPVVNSPLTPTTGKHIPADRRPSDRLSVSGEGASARPHDPPHLHAFSLLI
jgi:hypothetical protein